MSTRAPGRFSGWDDRDMSRNFFPFEKNEADTERRLRYYKHLTEGTNRILFQGLEGSSATVTIVASGVVLERNKNDPVFDSISRSPTPYSKKLLGSGPLATNGGLLSYIEDQSGTKRYLMLPDRDAIQDMVNSRKLTNTWWDKPFQETGDMSDKEMSEPSSDKTEATK